MYSTGAYLYHYALTLCSDGLVIFITDTNAHP